MDIGQLRGLLLDLDCMTALRHTLRNRAMAALVDLCRACAKDNADEAALTAAYCRVYDAWLDAAAHGRGGFAREDFAPEFNGTLCGKLNRHRNSVGKRWLMGKRLFYL